MEFVLGYLIGAGASWQTILVVVCSLAVIAIVLYNAFGIE